MPTHEKPHLFSLLDKDMLRAAFRMIAKILEAMLPDDSGYILLCGPQDKTTGHMVSNLGREQVIGCLEATLEAVRALPPTEPDEEE